MQTSPNHRFKFFFSNYLNFPWQSKGLSSIILSILKSSKEDVWLSDESFLYLDPGNWRLELNLDPGNWRLELNLDPGNLKLYLILDPGTRKLELVTCRQLMQRLCDFDFLITLTLKKKIIKVIQIFKVKISLKLHEYQYYNIVFRNNVDCLEKKRLMYYTM